MAEPCQGMLKGRTNSKNRVEASLFTLKISVGGHTENICIHVCVSVAPQKVLLVYKTTIIFLLLQRLI